MHRYAVAAVPLVLVPALGAVQGGFDPDAWVWSGALAAWAAALALTLGGGGRLRKHYDWLLAGAALLLWTLASCLWSVDGTQSLLDARRTVVYLAVVLALVALAQAGSAALVAAAVQASTTALVLYALTRYLFGPRTVNEFESTLLSEPLGYANAVGILAAIAIVLALGTATRARGATRLISCATVPLLALALELTGSRASWLALGVGLGVTVALDAERRRLGRAAAAVLPAAALAVWAAHHSGLASSSPARWSGPVVAAIGAGCAAAAAAAAALADRRRPRPARPLPRAFAVAAAAAALLAAAAGIAAAGTSGARSSYYSVAWHEYVAHPLHGSGAGTFGHFWLESGPVERWGGALDAHALYLETLAELGPIGLVLVLLFLLLPLRGVMSLRRIAPVPAAAGAAAAFLVHAGLDWDWEMPAVVVAGLSCLAAVAFARDGHGAPAPRPARLAALAAALLLGAAAIAGARSTAKPTAAPGTSEAPHSGASQVVLGAGRGGYLPLWPLP